LLSLQEFKQKWYGLACLLPVLALLAEFILATEAAHILLANFTEPIITLVSRKLHEWKCAENQGSFCQQDFKFRMYNHAKRKSKDMLIHGNFNTDLMAFQYRVYICSVNSEDV
jgi:hypothetical protein